MLTDKQQAVLDYIREMQQESGLIPSSREIQEHFGFASQNSAMNYLRALESKGVVKRRPGIARGVILPEFDGGPSIGRVPLYGMIPAGAASMEEQQSDGCVAVDYSACEIPKNARTFALRVRGDSMINAHIVEGDIVIMEFREPRNGDIVAALIDGETTLKRYVMERGRPHLKAENPRYAKLIPARELVIQGVLVALMRMCKRS